LQSKQFGRILFRGMLLALILVLLPLVAGFGVFSYKAHTIAADTRSALKAPLPPMPTPDPSRRIGVVLLSNNGTEITDALPPYELLAVSGAFSTYFITPERRVSPLMSGAGAAFAYDAVIADVVRHAGGAVARGVSRNFAYPVDPEIVSGATWTLTLILPPLMIGLLDLALIALLTRRRADGPVVSVGPA
jgi:hypothetical protein